MVRKSIIGLGNPGPRYAATRHNVGFRVVECLARRHAIALTSRAETAVWGDGAIAGSPVRLGKPVTFMNASGDALSALLAEEADPAGDLLVVHDELDLSLGRIKLKLGGGTAGHRGIASIAERLGDRGFARLRVGIGRPPAGNETVDFVLGAFSAEETGDLDALLERAADACEVWLALVPAAAMNRINAPPAAPAVPAVGEPNEASPGAGIATAEPGTEGELPHPAKR